MTFSAHTISMRATHREYINALGAGLLISPMLTTACNVTSIKGENTLSNPGKANITVQDENIEDSLHDTIESKQRVY